jgi:peptide/nickel transport system substrate-binding protein
MVRLTLSSFKSGPMRSSLVWLSVMVIGTAAIAGCGRRANRGSTKPDRVVIGTTSKITSLDPADVYSVFPLNLLYNLGDRLYDYEPGTGKLKPQLASAMPTISSDGLTYTIPIRKGVVFHDGTPFDAKAMAFSLQRFIENGGQPAFLLADTVAVVEAPTPEELIIKLKKPFAAFSNLLAFSGVVPVSPKTYKKGAGKFEPETFVGTGPYKLSKFGTDSVRLEAFDKYWGTKPSNKGIDVQVYSSSANLFNAFRTGAVDLAYQNLDPDQIQTLEAAAKKGNWQAISGPGNVVTYLVLNTKDPDLKKVKVRQALAAMIDRKVLKERVYRTQAEPAFTLIPTIFEGISQPVFQTQQKDLNQSKIKTLLKESGYSSGKPLKLTLWYRSNVTSNGVAAQTLKAMIGQNYSDVVQVNLDSVESTTAYKNLDKGTYPTFMLDWYGDFYDADNYIQPFLSCERGSVAKGCEKGQSKAGGSFFFSDRANQLIDQQRKEADPAKRAQLFRQLQQILVQEVPYIPLWQNRDFVFAQKGITGIQLQPSQQFPFSTLKK